MVRSRTAWPGRQNRLIEQIRFAPYGFLPGPRRLQPRFQVSPRTAPFWRKISSADSLWPQPTTVIRLCQEAFPACSSTMPTCSPEVGKASAKISGFFPINLWSSYQLRAGWTKRSGSDEIRTCQAGWPTISFGWAGIWKMPKPGPALSQYFPAVVR